MIKFDTFPFKHKAMVRLAALVFPALLAISCAPAHAPDGSDLDVPNATPPLERFEGLNEKRDPVTRVKLGRDVLVPQPLHEDVMPDVTIGPYELRGETLASALQLILDDYDVSLAFESNEGLTRKITVANLHGKLKDVVNRVCALADLYCHYEDNTLTIKTTETFIVDLPPLAASSSGGSSSSETSTDSGAAASSSTSSTSASSGAYSQITEGLKAMIGSSPTVDETTRVMIYTATQRSHKYALQYFARLRKNTALIIFETHVWEVTLNNNNSTGINWEAGFTNLGNFTIDTLVPGGIAGAATGIGAPVQITPTFTNGSGSVDVETVLSFLSSHGAVKTISQPQITVLSGSNATFAVEQNQNYVSKTTITPCSPDPCTPATSTETGTVKTGLTMNVASAWDQSTVYGTLNIALDDLLRIDNFGDVQLPQTTTRSLQTQIRVRPGDAILIGGLVSEKDDLSSSGPGFMTPLFTTNRVAKKTNTELVFLLRPRVIAFEAGDDSDTPPIVNAPKEDMATKNLPLPDLSDSVKDLFGFKAPEPAVAPPTPTALAPAPVATKASSKPAAKEKMRINK